MAFTKSDGVFLGWAAAYVVSQANILRTLGPAGPKLLKIQTATSAESYRAVLEGMDTRELAGYRAHYPLDMVHPVIYALALRAGARALGSRSPLSPRTRRFLEIAPVASAAGDYIENVVGWHLIDNRQHITDTGTRVVSAISTAKWALALGSLGYIAQGLARSPR
ncbi:hypothetical protein [Tomitella biformata]|uniref:hypothetical protein n=1 Tax=Tomitella biformata TaxID=630403 RepID=UPI00046730AA|nr:hypothetical protein [Tomitella biformata]